MTNHKWQKIDYKILNARQKEIINFQKLSSVLADYGFVCLKLSDDWQGADFLAYNMVSGENLKIQLKGRITIAKKYIGKSIYIAFQNDNHWYLVPHDDFLDFAQSKLNWINTKSWQCDGVYHSGKPSKEIIKYLEAYKL